jgi:plastocyanin
MRRLLILPTLLAALVLSSSASADNPVLTGDVGLNDAFAITLQDVGGNAVTHLDPGTYTLVIHDHSAIHNFHLFGPGTSATVASTDVEFVGDMTFTIMLADGTYTFVCDAHPTVMKGTFTVGTVPAPPPPPPNPSSTPTPRTARLTASVGPGAHIAVRGVAGLRPGKVAITVRDASAVDSFRLVGPGVNRATGVAFRGTVSWTVALKVGTYRFRSDRHPQLRGSFTVAKG